tara:strand:+ start:1120 stop:2208 length:1089 start_codon:yes stop_codon:yes gene_type:complete
MKIAYDYKIFWNQKYGGISRYFTNLFKKFNRQSLNYKVFAPFYKNQYLLELEYKNINGTYIKDNIPFTSNLIKFYNEIVCTRDINKWKPDLIHYTYYYNKIKKKNLSIVTVYDLIHEITSSKLNKIVKPKQNMLDISDHVICISKNTKNDLLNFYEVDEKKISVIYLGGNHLEEGISGFPERITNNIPFILYVGSREKYKNFEFLIKGYSKSKRLLSSVNIILFGGGKLKKKEKNLLYQLKIDESKIIQVDGNDSDLKDLYKKAKVFVFPSLYEGFGLPLLESLENNCPIACSDIPVFREILDDNAFFFNPECYESLITSLEKAIFEKNEIEIKKKYDSLKMKFSWNKCSTDTFNLYKKIIG